MVGGVYAPGKQNAYVTLRAVNRFTRHVIASTDFAVVLGPDVKNLLKTKDAGSNVIPNGSPGDLPEPVLEDAAPAAKDKVPAMESTSPKLQETPANNPAAGLKNYPPSMQ